MAAPPPDSNPNLQRAPLRLTKTANGSRVMGVHQKLRAAILLTSTSRLMEVTTFRATNESSAPRGATVARNLVTVPAGIGIPAGILMVNARRAVCAFGQLPRFALS